jgi:hypothetical protein
MKRTVAKKRYTASDMRAVSDKPEWTKRDFAKAKAFDEVFPMMRKGRGPNRAPTKKSAKRSRSGLRQRGRTSLANLTKTDPPRAE